MGIGFLKKIIGDWQKMGVTQQVTNTKSTTM